MVHQTQHAFCNDVEVDLARAAFDRIALRAKKGARCGKFLWRKLSAFPAKPLRAQRFDHQLRAILIYLRRGIFDDRGRRTWALALLRFFLGATYGEREGACLHLVRGDTRSKIAIGNSAMIRADML